MHTFKIINLGKVRPEREREEKGYKSNVIMESEYQIETLSMIF